MYKKTKATQKNYYTLTEDHLFKYQEEKKDFYIEFYTTEEYSVRKLTVLKQYFQDILILKSKPQDYYESVEYQLSVISHILNTPNSIEMRFLPTEHDITFQRIVPYGRVFHDASSGDNPCGRLYPLVPSMVQLSRQVRSYMFSHNYEDIDLVNSHPTILASYAVEHSLNAPRLLGYVLNREDVLREVSEERQVTRDDAKKLFLIAQNMNYIETKSSLVKEYCSEISTIRDHLLKSEYALFSTLIKRHSFKSKRPEEQAIVLQCYYCFNKESSLLLDLREFLNGKLNLPKRPKFISDKDFLHFVPFYDGAYIKPSSDIRNKTLCSLTQLESLVQEFNQKHKFFSFAFKPIDDVEFTYIDKKTLSWYISLLDDKNFSKGVSFTFDTKEITHHLKSDSKSLNLLKRGKNIEFNTYVQAQITEQMCRYRASYANKPTELITDNSSLQK